MYQITRQHIYAQARDAYFHGGQTQKDIANEVGITDRTLRNWIKEGCWDRLRQNANIAPAVMMDHFCSQLVQLQNKIAARPEEKRVPKSSEVEKQRKLLNCIINMQKYPFDTFKALAYGITPVSSLVPFTEEAEKEEIEEPKIDTETSLSGRYIAFEGKKAEKIFQEEKELQIIDNQYIEEDQDDENETEAEKVLTRPGYKPPVFVRRRNVILPSGVIWIQKGEMFDPATLATRRMTMEEWDILLSLGLGRLDFEGWCPALAGSGF